MPTPPLSDDVLREVVAVWRANDCKAAFAARAMGINPKTFDGRLAAAKSRGLHLSDGARHSVATAGLLPGEARGGYRRVYDEDGKQIDTVRWSIPAEAAEDAAGRIRATLEGLEPAPVVAAPEYVNDALCTVIPLADCHIGMMAWGQETGEDYDTSLSVARVRDWIGRAIDASPASGTAVILDAGDLTHADDQTNQTPKSKHGLDVDTRHFRTLDVTIAAGWNTPCESTAR